MVLDNDFCPAIVCIGYNRPLSMQRLLNSVGHAVYDDKNITLIISIDQSSKSDDVEQVAQNFQWNYGEKIIRRYPKRLGLKDHCLQCGDLSLQYGAIIFLEDDCVVAPGFYRFAKAACNFYKTDNHVFGVSLYSQKWVSAISCDFYPDYKGFDTYYVQRELSHGQCWIGKMWKPFREWYVKHLSKLPDNDNRVPIDYYHYKSETSWSKYLEFYLVENNLFYIAPFYSYATNLSEIGIHANQSSDICQTYLTSSIESKFKWGAWENTSIYDAFFEREDLFMDTISNIPLSEICIDLNSLKYNWSNYNYILTTRELPYEEISSFGIHMEPIENNVIYNVPGKSIRLYKIPANYKPSAKPEFLDMPKISNDRIRHCLNKIPIKHLAKHLSKRIIGKFLNKCLKTK